MEPNFNHDALGRLVYLVGDEAVLRNMPGLPAKKPFAEDVLDFLNDVSAALMRGREAKKYPDVVTFGFWLRKASLQKLRERFAREDDGIRVGRGVTFHIAPSNVPVNFAYSLASGLLTGNACVVRVPSKDFEQIRIVANAFRDALTEHPALVPYICLVRYERDKDVNDLLSSMADVRVVWGGDQTIRELRASPLPPRSGEVTFSDRFSFAIIDADAYLAAENKERIAEDFYNDTFLTDQNACTSPRLVVWTGEGKRRAKERFWDALHALALEKYEFQPIMGVNKLTDACLCAAGIDGAVLEPRQDNLIVRVRVPKISPALIGLSDNSGYFFEYDCADLMELRPLCMDNRCQTVAYLGEHVKLLPLLDSGVKGIDRVVPIGHTLDFDLLWDGYDLTERLTRAIGFI